MTRTADNTAWAILARHRYAEETARVMTALMLLRVDSFNLSREELESHRAIGHYPLPMSFYERASA